MDDLKTLLKKGIINNPILKNGINCVFLYSKEPAYDLWFVTKDNDFVLKHAISELFCNIVDLFEATVFDIMILTLDEIDIKRVKTEAFCQLFP